MVERQLAYLYYADTRDSREFEVADVRLSGPLFSAGLEALTEARRRGEARGLHPGLPLLPAALARLLGDGVSGIMGERGGAS